MKIDNDFLLKIDAGMFLFMFEQQNRVVGDIHFSEFRKFLYKKYYKEEKV